MEEWREVGERRKKVGERWVKMRETGDKGKKGEKGERRGMEEDYPLSSPSYIQGQFLSFWNHKCTSHPCHLKINKVQPPLLSDVANKAKDQDSFCKKIPITRPF